ncbi:hypothetical protein VT06_12085 [Arsukibacterium sp. MJ3]|nr:hypothetical protein VT06_12085 [Arsukibacterium sp. MJ3]
MSLLLTSGYAAWLSKARQALSMQQQYNSYVFLTDNTTVCFDNISYATSKILPENLTKPE